MADIIATDDVWQEFLDDSDINGRAQANAVMKFYADSGPQDLPKTKFVFEEWYKAEGLKVRTEAFKGYQTRLYGFSHALNGKMTFVITRLDLSKKDNKAKRRVLDAAGKEAIRIRKLLG